MATVLAALAFCLAGCDGSVSNLTASLGGETAGERGQVQVVFINNTPHRAVFTFGTYDDTDQDSQPDFFQFGLDDYDTTLDGNSTSEVGSLECARVFSVGGPKLPALIEEDLPDASPDEDAFVEGVKFFEIASDEADEEEPDSSEGDSGPTLAGTAAPLEALIGIDFSCGSLLIIRLEFDDLGPDPFRVDFEFIPSESTR
jgi:hypothetical protein